MSQTSFTDRAANYLDERTKISVAGEKPLGLNSQSDRELSEREKCEIE